MCALALATSPASADDRFGFPGVRAGRTLHYQAVTTATHQAPSAHDVVVRLSAPPTPSNGTTRVVRLELLDASGAALVPRIGSESLPGAIYVNRRGLRLDERGRVSLPTSFAHLPARIDPFARPGNVVATRVEGSPELGCLTYGRINTLNGMRESWLACFDASGTLRRYVSESGNGRFELTGPVATADDFLGSWFTSDPDPDADTTYEVSLRRDASGRIVGTHVTSSAASIECELVGRAPGPAPWLVDVRCVNHYVSEEDPEITEGTCALAIESDALELRSVSGQPECPVGGPPIPRGP